MSDELTRGQIEEVRRFSKGEIHNLPPALCEGRGFWLILEKLCDIALRALPGEPPRELSEERCKVVPDISPSEWAANTIRQALRESRPVEWPEEPTERLRIAAGDIGDGFDLTADQICIIYKAMRAAHVAEKEQS